MQTLRKIVLLLFLAGSIKNECAGQKPFADEITNFKKQDKEAFPPTGAILFVGGSSFRKWENIQAYFPRHIIINRGFGGAVIPDVRFYAKDIVFPYHPKQIIIYCGDNDLASSDTITPMIVFRRFLELYFTIRKHLPAIELAYVSIKPSPLRQALMGKMKEANTLIKAFLGKRSHNAFIDVYSKMILPDGTPRPDIFVEDNLHMNSKGYAIWQKAIEPYLK